jgi:hypothetical protein
MALDFFLGHQGLSNEELCLLSLIASLESLALDEPGLFASQVFVETPLLQLLLISLTSATREKCESRISE